MSENNTVVFSFNNPYFDGNRPKYIIMTKKMRLFVYKDYEYIIERVSKQRIPHNSLLLSEYSNVELNSLPQHLLEEISELMTGVKFETKK